MSLSLIDANCELILSLNAQPSSLFYFVAFEVFLNNDRDFR